MAQLGVTSIGDPRALNGTAKGLRVTMPVAAQSGFSIFAYLSDSSAGANYRAALIHDGNKITVLAASALRTDVSTTGWYEFSGGDFTSYAPTNGETFVLTVASDSALAATAHQADLGLDGWTAPSGISDIDPLTLVDPMVADTVRDYSIYLEYTEQSGSTVTLTASLHEPIIGGSVF